MLAPCGRSLPLVGTSGDMPFHFMEGIFSCSNLFADQSGIPYAR
jgi:hypothetical protein